MSKVLVWVAAHYIKAGIYLLSTAAAVLVAVLGTALPQLGLTSRLPRWLATCCGLILVLFSSILAVAKLTKPKQLGHVSWFGPPIIFVFGSVFLIAAWLLKGIYVRRMRQRLEPLADAAWRKITQVRRQPYENSNLTLHSLQGKPVVQELISIIGRRRTATIAMLAAPTGTGKTKTLFDIAEHCRSAWVKMTGPGVVPIYVDLAGFAAEPIRAPLREYILKELGSDEDLIKSFGEAWHAEKLGATWLFLFDNADQVLARRPQGEKAYDWYTELIEFMGANGRNSRAIVTAHVTVNFPDTFRVEISSIDPESREIFLTERGLARAQQDALTVGKSFSPYIGNLSWLDFVGSYLAAHPGDEPETFYDLMTNCIAHRIAETRHRNAYADAHDDLMYNIAGQAASQLCGFSHSVSRQGISKTELIRCLSHGENNPSEDVNLAVAELLEMNLLSSYLNKNDEDCLRFTHDGIQVYFATFYLLQIDPSALEPNIVFANSRWSTIVISLIQRGDRDMTGLLLDAAQGILSGQSNTVMTTDQDMINRFLRSGKIPERDFEQEQEASASSPGQAYQVLHILDAAFQRQSLLISDSLRDEADRFIARNFSKAIGQERAQIISIQNLAHADVAAATCAAGLHSQSGRLVHEAAVQITNRCQVMDLLSLKDRMRFLLVISLIGLDTWTAQHISPTYRERLKFASLVSTVTAWLFVLALGFVGVVSALTRPDTWQISVTKLAIATILLVIVLAARRINWIMNRLLGSGAKFPLGLVTTLAAIGGLAFLSIIIYVLEGSFPSLSTLLLAAALLWPIGALYYLAIESDPSFSKWAFPFIVIIFPAWQLLATQGSRIQLTSPKRLIISAGLLGVGISDALALSVIMRRGWHFKNYEYNKYHDLYLTLRWVSWAVLLYCIVAFPVADFLHDFRRLRQWHPPGKLQNADVVEWITRLRSSSGITRMLFNIETRLSPYVARDAIDSLTDLWKMFEAINAQDLESSSISSDTISMIPSFRTPDIEIWLKTFGEKYPGRLRKVALRHEKRLAAYIASVKQSTNLSVQLPLFSQM